MVVRIKKLLVLIFILGLIIVPTNIQAEYAVREGDIFLYDIIISRLDATVENNSTSTQGCYIGTKVAEGEQFFVNVTYSSFTSIIYKQQYQNYSQEYASIPSLLYEILPFRFETPTNLAYTFTEYWSYANETYNSKGLAVESIFFFDLYDNTWREIKDALIRHINNMLDNFSPYISYDYDTKFKETKKEYRAEWFVTMDYHYPGISDYTYSQGYKLVYSAINGALLGAHIKGHCEGYMDNINFSLSYDQHVEMANYNLDGFEIGEFKTIPGFGFILPIITFMFLTVIIRKKTK